MNRIIKASVAMLAAAVMSTSALAQDWTPPGPIKLIIAFRAGGGADTHARLIAEDLKASKGWDIIPEQITGKGGLNALVALKDMPNDGSVMAMVVTESIGYNSASAKGAGITPSDFAGITTTAGFQMGLVSKADTGWNTFSDLVAAAKGGKEIRFGSMSPKISDLAYLLGEVHGIEFNTVAVKGGKAVMNGVMAGDLDVGFMAGIQGKGVAAGDLVNLASGLSTPLTQTPDAPTLADLGVNFNADGYFVLVAPAGVPEEARNALAAAIAESTISGKANGMVTKAFGGPVNIMGAELDTLLQAGYDDAAGLMAAAQ